MASYPALFHSLVEDYSQKVFNLALRILGSREEAEEATQDVFVRVWRALPTFRGEAKISTWIWRITTNVCLSRRRKKSSSPLSLDNLLQQGAVDVENDQKNPLQITIDQDECFHLREMIAQLPAEEAAAITLFYLEGCDYKEIGEILQLPAGTVAVKLHRGRERLRKLYERSKRD